MLITSNSAIFDANLIIKDIELTDISQGEVRDDNSESPSTKGIKVIALSEEDRQRIYEPWKYAIIVKLVGKRMMHHYLQKKIQDLWRPTEDLQMIDLGEDYYIIKFKKRDNMEKAVQQGPWFINGHFLSITKLKPNFVASKERFTTMAFWIRLPQLPTEFYDGEILRKIGNAIGRLLKVDVCTSTTLKGRYARLCIELPLEIPVQQFLYVGKHEQQIHYEGENFLCTICSRLGHTKNQCSFVKLNATTCKEGTEAPATNSTMEK
ncbi:PREDICTED: uncharacterized protein LOC109220933 [Nicotiana attenuata]|uniref:uncharacterized protein LOC109220933 n=1 Tax=Nicotiana attenuata TaxID=49451 RepID=UPI0009047EC8|nr:PREDICTED: uncharacterized protein LOC109220933 [Nicotiana attenuata]